MSPGALELGADADAEDAADFRQNAAAELTAGVRAPYANFGESSPDTYRLAITDSGSGLILSAWPAAPNSSKRWRQTLRMAA